MWELDCKESWASKNWCFWTVVLQKTPESPLDCKEIQPVHTKGDQSWMFIGRTDSEAETLILWPPDAKSWLIWEDTDAGKDWGQEEKGTTEDEMVGWHHRLNGHGFGWTLGVGDEQGGLACCGSQGCKELDMTEWLKWTELNGFRTWLQIFCTGWLSHQAMTSMSPLLESGMAVTVLVNRVWEMWRYVWVPRVIHQWPWRFHVILGALCWSIESLPGLPQWSTG